jgi:hypothetical protein
LLAGVAGVVAGAGAELGAEEHAIRESSTRTKRQVINFMENLFTPTSYINGVLVK